MRRTWIRKGIMLVHGETIRRMHFSCERKLQTVKNEKNSIYLGNRLQSLILFIYLIHKKQMNLILTQIMVMFSEFKKHSSFNYKQKHKNREKVCNIVVLIVGARILNCKIKCKPCIWLVPWHNNLKPLMISRSPATTIELRNVETFTQIVLLTKVNKYSRAK